MLGTFGIFGTYDIFGCCGRYIPYNRDRYDHYNLPFASIIVTVWSS